MQPHLGTVQPHLGTWLASVQPDPQARTARVQPERSPSPHRARASVGITKECIHGVEAEANNAATLMAMEEERV